MCENVFDYQRTFSVTQMFCKLGLPTFDTLMHNSHIIFQNMWQSCANNFVASLYRIGRWRFFDDVSVLFTMFLVF